MFSLSLTIFLFLQFHAFLLYPWLWLSSCTFGILNWPNAISKKIQSPLLVSWHCQPTRCHRLRLKMINIQYVCTPVYHCMCLYGCIWILILQILKQSLLQLWLPTHSTRCSAFVWMDERRFLWRAHRVICIMRKFLTFSNKSRVFSVFIICVFGLWALIKWRYLFTWQLVSTNMYIRTHVYAHIHVCVYTNICTNIFMYVLYSYFTPNGGYVKSPATI